MRISVSVLAVVVLTGCTPLLRPIGPAAPAEPAQPAVEVPSFAGLDMSQAFGRIGEAGLCLGEIDAVEGGFARVRVVDQDPQAGTVVRPGTKVSLRFGIPKGSAVGWKTWRKPCATRG